MSWSECRLFRRGNGSIYCFVLALILSVIAGAAFAEQSKKPKFVPDELIVRPKPGMAAELAGLNRSTGAKIKRDLKKIGYVSLKLPKGADLEQTIERYKKHPAVEYAGPNRIFHVLVEPTGVVPNDPYFRESYDVMYDIFPEYLVTPPQWGLFNDGYNYSVVFFMPEPLYGVIGVDINASHAWKVFTDLQIPVGNSDVVIAVLDTGIDFIHPDFVKSNGESKIWANPNEIPDNLTDDDNNGYVDDVNGWNFSYNNNYPMDDYSGIMHGTWVSSIAGAATDNGIGIAGVAWECPIMPLKVVDSQDNATEDDIAAAVTYAVDMGAKVINMSIGLDAYSEPLEAAVDDAWARGAIAVCANGNSGDGTIYYPAAYDNSLAVGAINQYGVRCTATDWTRGGSSYANHMDISAPGNEILGFSSAWNEHTYMSYPGTSGAAPFVSGIAALVWSLHPTWTNAQVVDQLKYTAIDVTSDPAEPGAVLTGWDKYTGWGRVDAYRALTETIGFVESMAAAKQAAPGQAARLSGVFLSTASGEIPGRLYAQEADRSAGILLSFSGSVPTGFLDGDKVDVQGTISKVQGECAISNPTITKSMPLERTIPKPLGVTNRALGGGQQDQQGAVVDQYSLPRTFAEGLNNIGLLVTTWGKVTAVSSSWFYIDDGSNLEDDTGNSGVYVYCGTLVRPGLNKYVAITGISGCEALPTPNDNILRRVLRPRRQSDIVVFQ